MEEQELRGHVSDGYQLINDKWMVFHFHLLTLCTLVTGTLEILMFFIIYQGGTLNCTISEYWNKYIIVPVFLNICIMLTGHFMLKNKKLSIKSKQYSLSFLFTLLAFVLALMHSGFVAVLIAFIYPITMTIMYENQKLTAITAVLSGIMQFSSGYLIFWDKDKVVNNDYFINLLILLTALFATWLICFFMIKFMKMKREIILKNDLERHKLRIRVHIDGLTKVGNKEALMGRLDNLLLEGGSISCFVMLDIDEFKKINDVYGHVFGDDVLRCVGDALLNIQVAAEAFRYGGDEFCILFSEPSMEAVVEEVERIQNYLQRNIELPDNNAIYISAGITHYTEDISWWELIQQADNALYESKNYCGNRISIYSGLN